MDATRPFPPGRADELAAGAEEVEDGGGSVGMIACAASVEPKISRRKRSSFSPLSNSVSEEMGVSLLEVKWPFTQRIKSCSSFSVLLRLFMCLFYVWLFSYVFFC